MITIRIARDNLFAIQNELLVVYLFKDIIPLKGHIGYIDWFLNSNISRLIKAKKLSGTFKEAALILGNNKFKTDKILIIGMGKNANLSSSKLIYTYSHLISIILGLKTYNFTVNTFNSSNSDLDYNRIVNDMIDGLAKGILKFEKQIAHVASLVINVLEQDEKKIPLLNKTISYAIARYHNRLNFIFNDIIVED